MSNLVVHKVTTGLHRIKSGMHCGNVPGSHSNLSSFLLHR